MKVLIAVTHLLGTGHLARALTLARAYIAAGDQVVIASGGMPVPHLDRGDVPIVQLPALRSDGVDFSRLLDGAGSIALPQIYAERRAVLIETLQSLRPDVLITELYPFGRRNLRGEFDALLEAALKMHRKPVICASVRDILAPPSKPAKAARTEDIIANFYDAVLVHGDAEVVPLEASWPVTPGIAAKIRYTGYVAPPLAPPHPDGVGKGEIVVSAGGGRVGEALFTTAAAAARARPDQRWRFLGRAMGALPGNVIQEPPRPDFRQILPLASASVSLCGYNTALDVLQTGVPAVFIPFDAGGETEQSQRAMALAALPAIETLPDAKLSPDALLMALDRVRCFNGENKRIFPANGALRTVDITRQLRENAAC